MANRQDGGKRRSTPNTVKSLKRKAEHRRCPACKRGAALAFVNDGVVFGYACRWCDYTNLTERKGDE